MPWKKGESGNPAGRAQGSRNRLADQFLDDALKAWEKHGKKALDTMAVDDPSRFAMMVSGILPKELHVTSHELTADEITRKLAEFAGAAAARTLELAAAHAEAQRKGVVH